MMDEVNVEAVRALKKWFSAYTRPYKTGGSELRRNALLKQQHSLRVCREIVLLAKSLELPEDRTRRLEIIALFHDIGRFEQYARHGTFMDARSENHAELGVRILNEEKVLDRFDPHTRNLMFEAIRHHNRAALPDDDTLPWLEDARFLRDADKLDIWRVMTDYYSGGDAERNVTLELDLPDTPGVSPGVCGDLMARRIVNVAYLKNFNDFKMLQVGWIFDVNFTETLRQVRSRQYLEKIRKALPASNDVCDVFRCVENYLEDRIDSNTAIA